MTHTHTHTHTHAPCTCPSHNCNDSEFYALAHARTHAHTRAHTHAHMHTLSFTSTDTCGLNMVDKPNFFFQRIYFSNTSCSIGRNKMGVLRIPVFTTQVSNQEDQNAHYNVRIHFLILVVLYHLAHIMTHCAFVYSIRQQQAYQ